MARNATAEDWNEWQRRMEERNQQEEQFRKRWSAHEKDKKEYNERFFHRADGLAQFTREHFVSIREIFEIPNGNPLEWAKPNKAVVSYQDGRQTVIEPHRISFDGNAPTDEQYAAAMKYIAKHWNGQAHMNKSPNGCREHRLKSLAYAQVYGIKLFDHNNDSPDTALTKAELARLPELCAHIRRVHADAPPERPQDKPRHNQDNQNNYD